MQFKVSCKNIQNTLLSDGRKDLEIFFGKADNFLNRVPFCYNILSKSEKARANRFKHASDYNCYVLVHGLLRIELSKIIGTKANSLLINETKTGKPFIPGMDLPFSISRTKNSFVFVIGRIGQFLGIDIEQIEPEIDLSDICRNYLSIKEQQFVFSFDRIVDQSHNFFEIWTRKEALLKAIGVGINTELSKVQVLEGENHIDIAGVQINVHSFKITTIMNNRALISIASSFDFTPGFKDLSL
jgi:4'-phosphopantetheinyl transferase